MPKKPIILIVRDGFGFNPNNEHNAVYTGKTPNHDRYCKEYPATLISSSGLDVGLPAGNQGSSEVGHLNLGAGRVVFQSLGRINNSIEEGSFFKNETFTRGIQHVNDNNAHLHLMGLVQDQGVHAHTDHLLALMKLAKWSGLESERCLVHIFADGRDTPPESAAEYIREITDFIEKKQYGMIVTLCGRYYAMDRDNRWERVQLAYDMLARGTSTRPSFDSVYDAVEDAYKEDETDEFIKPRIIDGFSGVQDNDCLIHFNYRLDRTRELTRAFVEDGFSEFDTMPFDNLEYVCTTEYYEGVDASSRASVGIAFSKIELKNLFGQFLADRGLGQLRIAETEKYAHVTFFFNGQSDLVFEGEDRILINSPKVATYDLEPEMSAYEVTDALLGKLDEDIYDVIVLNFANCDMVGHTGVFEAAVKAVEVVDECVGRIVDRILEKDGVVLLTSDHGNAEQMIAYETGKPMTAHTTNKVWLSLISKRSGLHKDEIHLREDGRLADVIPTMIEIMGLEQPREMTGRSMIVQK